jgi:Mor family transcriptional regulator
MMGVPRMAARNREIFLEFLNGASKDSFAVQYGLTMKRIEEVLRAERHKASVSPDPRYRQLRHLIR